MRMARCMLVLVIAACGGSRGARPMVPATPAADLAAARSDAERVDASATGLAAKEPRVVDLDIIRIRATGKGVGGEPELTSVASADLFRDAGEAAKDGRHTVAIQSYRQLIAEFPDSQYAPLALFNIAAIYDKQGDWTSTVTTLRELVAAYP